MAPSKIAFADVSARGHSPNGTAIGGDDAGFVSPPRAIVMLKDVPGAHRLSSRRGSISLVDSGVAVACASSTPGPHGTVINKLELHVPKKRTS